MWDTFRMWHPSRRQWPVIWIAAILALGLWVAAAGEKQSFTRGAGWSYGSVPTRLAGAILLLGAIAVWQRAEPH